MRHDLLREFHQRACASNLDSELEAWKNRPLEGRREELASGRDILEGIGIINAQLEDTESLLSNLRAELLALDTSLSPGSLEPGLAHLKERVSYFRRSMDEVRRSVEALPVASAERLPAPPDEREATRY